MADKVIEFPERSEVDKEFLTIMHQAEKIKEQQRRIEKLLKDKADK
jgi:hypothetical protein